MENRINVAQILKDLPKGTKLYSPLFGNCELDSVDSFNIKIKATSLNDGIYTFNRDGCYYGCIEESECILFPSKENRDWNKFQKPFKDGDILTYTGNYTTTFIYRKKDNEHPFATSFYVGCNDAPFNNFFIYNKYTLITLNEDCDVRLATEDEKIKLFEVIKENGYIWNAETKTLKKLDISTLKPFDKVLTRIDSVSKWNINIFAYYDFDRPECPYTCIHHHHYAQCIPYEGNEYLLNTTNNCY